MSVRCMTWVLDNSPATGNDRLVLIVIADEADDDGRNAFPGIPRISHKSRVPVRTVHRCLDRLERGGQLLIRRPDTKGRGHHNRYVVVMGRDPVALAGEVGWPPPNLDPAVAAEWCHSGTDTDPGEPGDNPVDDRPGTVGNVDEKARNGATSDPETCRQVAPDPSLPRQTPAAAAAARPQVDDDAGRDPIPAGGDAPAIIEAIRSRHLRKPPPAPDVDDTPAPTLPEESTA